MRDIAMPPESSQPLRTKLDRTRFRGFFRLDGMRKVGFVSRPSATSGWPPVLATGQRVELVQGVDGTRIGLENRKSKKMYLLYVGESEDEIHVVKADFDTEAALLRKGTEEDWIYMDESKNAPVASATHRSPTLSTPRPPTRHSYRSRLNQRREALEKARAERMKKPVEKYTGPALKKHLEEYQMDLIRKGMPPLPVPLTPEMDATLVEEGVLPPMEEATAE